MKTKKSYFKPYFPSNKEIVEKGIIILVTKASKRMELIKTRRPTNFSAN